ncbi:MAG: heme-binding protein [Chitinophagaceae bacterium]
MDITLEWAEASVRQAFEKAKKMNVQVNIAVMDTGGHLKSFTRMDEAYLGSIDIALQKAKTAMLFRTASENVGEFLKPSAGAYGIENTNGGLAGFAGGRPITHDGKIIGYIGVSGGAVSQDAEIALAGSVIP